MTLSARVAKMIRSATLLKNRNSGKVASLPANTEGAGGREAPTHCPYCEGKGWRLFVGSGIEGWEPCDDCGGTGRFYRQRGIAE